MAGVNSVWIAQANAFDSLLPIINKREESAKGKAKRLIEKLIGTNLRYQIIQKAEVVCMNQSYWNRGIFRGDYQLHRTPLKRNGKICQFQQKEGSKQWLSTSLLEWKQTETQKRAYSRRLGSRVASCYLYLGSHPSKSFDMSN